MASTFSFDVVSRFDFQELKNAIDQASRRGSPTRIEVSLRPTANKGAQLVVSDDGLPERRRGVLDALAERAATLNARFDAQVDESRGTTIRIELPEGFQTSEFLLEHGFVDRIVPRWQLKTEIANVIDYCGK